MEEPSDLVSAAIEAAAAAAARVAAGQLPVGVAHTHTQALRSTVSGAAGAIAGSEAHTTSDGNASVGDDTGAQGSEASGTQYRGVAWSHTRRAFRVMLNHQNQTIEIGAFATPLEAAVAYDEAARLLHSSKARLNFPRTEAERGCMGRSEYRGISWQEKCHKWECRIKFGRKMRYIGVFVSEEEAAAAWDMEALRLRGPTFEHLNFPDRREAYLQALADEQGGTTPGAAASRAGRKRGRRHAMIEEAAEVSTLAYGDPDHILRPEHTMTLTAFGSPGGSRSTMTSSVRSKPSSRSTSSRSDMAPLHMGRRPSALLPAAKPPDVSKEASVLTWGSSGLQGSLGAGTLVSSGMPAWHTVAQPLAPSFLPWPREMQTFGVGWQPHAFMPPSAITAVGLPPHGMDAGLASLTGRAYQLPPMNVPHPDVAPAFFVASAPTSNRLRAVAAAALLGPLTTGTSPTSTELPVLDARATPTAHGEHPPTARTKSPSRMVEPSDAQSRIDKSARSLGAARLLPALSSSPGTNEDPFSFAVQGGSKPHDKVPEGAPPQLRTASDTGRPVFDPLPPLPSPDTAGVSVSALPFASPGARERGAHGQLPPFPAAPAHAGVPANSSAQVSFGPSVYVAARSAPAAVGSLGEDPAFGMPGQAVLSSRSRDSPSAARYHMPRPAPQFHAVPHAAQMGVPYSVHMQPVTSNGMPPLLSLPFAFAETPAWNGAPFSLSKNIAMAQDLPPSSGTHSAAVLTASHFTAVTGPMHLPATAGMQLMLASDGDGEQSLFTPHAMDALLAASRGYSSALSARAAAVFAAPASTVGSSPRARTAAL